MERALKMAAPTQMSEEDREARLVGKETASHPRSLLEGSDFKREAKSSLIY